MGLVEDFKWFFNTSKRYNNYDGMGIVGKLIFLWHVPSIFLSYRKIQRLSKGISHD
jgi:hypothetical protein